MIVWINGTHGVGRSTASALPLPVTPDSRLFDAEMIGELLAGISPGLPPVENFSHRSPWRSLVVETAHQGLVCTGGTRLDLTGMPPWGVRSTGSFQWPARQLVRHIGEPLLRSSR